MLLRLFSTSRDRPTFHSTCQLPQSVWVGNLLPRLSYLLLSHCQGCLGEKHCEVTDGCASFFVCVMQMKVTRGDAFVWVRKVIGETVHTLSLRRDCVLINMKLQPY